MWAITRKGIGLNCIYFDTMKARDDVGKTTVHLIFEFPHHDSVGLAHLIRLDTVWIRRCTGFCLVFYMSSLLLTVN